MEHDICELQYSLFNEEEKDIYGNPDLPVFTETQLPVEGAYAAPNDDEPESEFGDRCTRVPTP
jgi:hypothetical protein